MKYLLCLLTIGVLFSSCGSSEKPAGDGEKDGWTYLFDGSSIDQWRSYNADTFPSGWKIQDDMLVVRNGGGDLMTKAKFTNFELELDFQLTDSANSGIFYRVLEVDTMAIWNNAPEYQLLDNEFYKKELGDNDMKTHYTAENYDLQSAAGDYTKPIGEWNSARIVVNNNHVEHWLNGKKTVEYDINSDEWKALYEKSKFSRYPQYGQTEAGHIGLQDHGHTVRFKNIRIKEL